MSQTKPCRLAKPESSEVSPVRGLMISWRCNILLGINSVSCCNVWRAATLWHSVTGFRNENILMDKACLILPTFSALRRADARLDSCRASVFVAIHLHIHAARCARLVAPRECTDSESLAGTKMTPLVTHYRRVGVYPPSRTTEGPTSRRARPPSPRRPSRRALRLGAPIFAARHPSRRSHLRGAPTVVVQPSSCATNVVVQASSCPNHNFEVKSHLGFHRHGGPTVAPRPLQRRIVLPQSLRKA